MDMVRWTNANSSVGLDFMEVGSSESTHEAPWVNWLGADRQRLV